MSSDPQERLADAKRQPGEHAGVNPSIEISTTFSVDSASEFPELFSGALGPENGRYLYGRLGNPNVHHLGRQLAAIEGAEAGHLTASGLGAISGALLHLLDSGDHIVIADNVYGGTHALVTQAFPRKFGISSTAVSIIDLEAVEAAFTPNTKVLYAETLSNPRLLVADIPELARIAHKHGAKLVIDNTFAPLIVSPLSHGADVVVHSVTKFIAGGADAIAGAILGSKEFIRGALDIVSPVILLGSVLDPTTASSLSQRLPHLPIRIREHGARALAYATLLEKLGAKVIYPGLPSHPHHERLRALSNEGYGAGGMLGIDLGSSGRARAFVELLQGKYGWGLLAVSLGYYDSLFVIPAESTSSELTDDELATSGVSPGLVRVSVGFTGSLNQRLKALESAYRELEDIK